MALTSDISTKTMALLSFIPFTLSLVLSGVRKNLSRYVNALIGKLD